MRDEPTVLLLQACSRAGPRGGAWARTSPTSGGGCSHSICWATAGASGPRSTTVETLANDVLNQVHGQRVDLIVGHSLGAIVALKRRRAADGAGARGRDRGPAGRERLRLDQEAVAAEVEAAVARTHRTRRPRPPACSSTTRYGPADDARRLVESAPRARRRAGRPGFLRAEPLEPARSSSPRARSRSTCWPPRPPRARCSSPTAAALLSALPTERVSQIAGGHALHRDRPALWLNTVLEFAASLDLRAGRAAEVSASAAEARRAEELTRRRGGAAAQVDAQRSASKATARTQTRSIASVAVSDLMSGLSPTACQPATDASRSASLVPSPAPAISAPWAGLDAV